MVVHWLELELYLGFNQFVFRLFDASYIKLLSDSGTIS